jgi:hypothetical protein
VEVSVAAESSQIKMTGDAANFEKCLAERLRQACTTLTPECSVHFLNSSLGKRAEGDCKTRKDSKIDISLPKEAKSQPEDKSSEEEKKEKKRTDPQRVFIRADKLDNPYPGLTIKSETALGASVAYTGNDFVQKLVKTKTGSVVTVSSSQALVVSGMASYAFIPDNKVTWIGKLGDVDVDAVPSIWLYGAGNWDFPTKTFGETSAAKIGGEIDFELQPPGSELWHYLGISPFYQTDFYGVARAEGATLSWTPAYRPLGILESPFDKPDLVDGFLELRAESTYLHVENPGFTNMRRGDYEWAGGAARAYIFLFPSKGDAGWSPYIEDRFSIVLTAQHYWDANSRIVADMFSGAFQYKLSCDNAGKMSSKSGGKTDCGIGSPSLTFQYDNGVDRDTLQETRKMSVKLNYAF